MLRRRGPDCGGRLGSGKHWREAGREYEGAPYVNESCGTVIAIRCIHCLDDGIVCEDHPEFPWDMTVEGHSADCGAPGMPCGYCCSPIPENGTESIVLAFTPDWKRA